jgi:hypothetical protein
MIGGKVSKLPFLNMINASLNSAALACVLVNTLNGQTMNTGNFTKKDVLRVSLRENVQEMNKKFRTETYPFT